MAEDLQFKVGVTANTAGLDQVEDKVKDLGKAAQETAGEFKGFSDEQKKAAQELADSLPPLKKTVAEADNLKKTLGETKSAVSGLGNVLGGIFTGDLLQAGKGLIELGRAAQGATGAMKEFLTSAARGSAIGAVIAAPVLIAVGLMKKFTEIYEKEMEEIWAHQGEQTKALGEKQKAAAEEAAAAQERLKQAYEDTTRAIEAQGRVAAAVAAEKTKQALLGATSSGDKQRIEDAAAVSSADSEIALQERLMNEADRAGDVEGFNRARDNLAIARERKTTATKTQSANAAARNKALSTDRAGLAAQAAEQQAAGRFAEQDETVKAIRKLDAELKKNGSAVTDAIKDTTKTVEKNTAKTKGVRESGGGGG